MHTERKLTTWDEVIQALGNYNNKITPHPEFLFRGQSDSSWDLKPSLARLLSEGCSRETALQIENEIINKFSLSAEQLLPIEKTIKLTLAREPGRIDYFGWLAVMQHYSAPTRTLDWSSSPWVALYFSCRSNIKKDGSIWIIESRKINHISGQDAEKNFITDCFDTKTIPINDAVQIITPLNTNERIEAQQGRFTVCKNPLINHADLIEETSALQKITISADLKRLVMKQLHHMNISARTLFPGIDGLGRAMTEYCELWEG